MAADKWQEEKCKLVEERGEERGERGREGGRGRKTVSKVKDALPLLGGPGGRGRGSAAPIKSGCRETPESSSRKRKREGRKRRWVDRTSQHT